MPLIGPSHRYTDGCKGCIAREISRGPNFHASATQGSLTRQYIDELLRCNITHEQVKEAAERDALNQRKETA